jgi:hypothetical protein
VEETRGYKQEELRGESTDLDPMRIQLHQANSQVQLISEAEHMVVRLEPVAFALPNAMGTESDVEQEIHTNS